MAVEHKGDGEYSDVGDPCWELAGLCTLPAHLNLPVEVTEFVIEEHALVLRSVELTGRTWAPSTAALELWCARESSTLVFARLSGANTNPRFDDAARSDHYRNRLADVLGVERRDVDRALET
jgi:hypothetical protein